MVEEELDFVADCGGFGGDVLRWEMCEDLGMEVMVTLSLRRMGSP